jgi:Zn-dependent protease
MDFAQIIQSIAVNAIPLLFAITLHEAAHGYAARRFGDNTAYLMGRITLNPLKHIDPVGTIGMPILLYFATAGAFLFGYAKPVPVNFGRLRNPKRDMIWVALAGPGSNLVQAVLWATLGYLLAGAGLEEAFFFLVVEAGIKWNLILLIFNLLPLPPLDGGRNLVGLLPPGPSLAVAKVEPYGFFVLLALVFTGLVQSYWLQPLYVVFNQIIALLLTPLRMLIL